MCTERKPPPPDLRQDVGMHVGVRPWQGKMASRLKRPMAQFLWRKKGTVL